MKNRILNKFISVVALCLVANASQAALINSSVDIVHDYGNAAGKYSPNSLNSSNTCDTLSTNSVNITDNSSGCGRFYDAFDFSSYYFASVDSFELSLTYKDTNDSEERGFWIFSYTDYEDWNVRPGASGSYTSGGYNYTSDQDIEIGNLFFDESAVGSDVWDNMLTRQNFALMFAEESAGTNDNFNLYDVTLTINGKVQEVPEPSMLALFGLGLLFISRAKFRKS